MVQVYDSILQFETPGNTSRRGYQTFVDPVNPSSAAGEGVKTRRRRSGSISHLSGDIYVPGVRTVMRLMNTYPRVLGTLAAGLSWDSRGCRVILANTSSVMAPSKSSHRRCSSGSRSDDNCLNVWGKRSRIRATYGAAFLFQKGSWFIPAPRPGALREEAIRRVSLYIRRGTPEMTAIFPRTRSLAAAISEHFSSFRRER